MSIPTRLLALEIRASRLGFAVFEGPTRLLDWGVRSFEDDARSLTSSVSDRIGILFAFHQPFAIVICDRTYHAVSHKRKLAKIVSAIRAETRRSSTKFVVLTAREVRNSFVANGKITKYDVALRVAEQFEELSWKLPHRRKSYQSEPPAMLVFDAVANGIAFFGKRIHTNPTIQPKC
jgi:hypothetical protein